MDYLTSAECAEKWNVSQRWVAIYCKNGRIKGAIQRGRMWFIPADTENPLTRVRHEKWHKIKSKIMTNSIL